LALFCFCGDAGSRTLVQTKHSSAFYMLICCSGFRIQAGTADHVALFLSSKVSGVNRSILPPQSAGLFKCGYRRVSDVIRAALKAPQSWIKQPMRSYYRHLLFDRHLLRSEPSCSGMLTNQFSFLSIPVIPIVWFRKTEHEY
jgi:hypothetical protein